MEAFRAANRRFRDRIEDDQRDREQKRKMAEQEREEERLRKRRAAAMVKNEKAKEKRAQTKRQKTIEQQAEAATFWARHIAQQDGEPAAIRFVGKTRFPKEIYERLLVRTGSQRRLVLQEKATPNRSTVVVVDVGTPTLQDENLIPPGRLGLSLIHI